MRSGADRVAVGTAVARCPPHRPVLALLNAHGSYLGYWRRSTLFRMGLSFPSCCGSSRTRSSPLGPPSRLGVRYGFGCRVFSLVGGLSSTTSAGDLSLLFGCFAGTTPPYDSPLPCMGDLWLIAFSPRPADCSRATTGSPGSRAWSFSACLGSSTPRVEEPRHAEKLHAREPGDPVAARRGDAAGRRENPKAASPLCTATGSRTTA